MAKNVYKNVSEVTQAVMGVGIVKPGKTIETNLIIENPNFKKMRRKHGTAR